MLFASKYSFNFVRTSRRDDLISLVYLLIFLIDHSRLTFINIVEGLSKKDKFNLIKNQKMMMTTKDLCGSVDQGLDVYNLHAFIDEVMLIDFKEEPNYNKLRFCLAKCLLDVDCVPDKRCDWNHFFILENSKLKEDDKREKENKNSKKENNYK
jgi:hypothetical protein